MKSPRNYPLLIGLALAATLILGGQASAKLTASTTLTVVNVTDYQVVTSSNIPNWTGDWPEAPDDDAPNGYQLYLKSVEFATHHMSWATVPYPIPYNTFPNTINSMVAAVWSKDGGRTFRMLSWDYLTRTTPGKGTEAGMPDCFMGTIIHTVCERKVGECNGKYRSNLLFENWPSGNTNCWATTEVE